jgi:hypothetical protein
MAPHPVEFESDPEQRPVGVPDFDGRADISRHVGQ